MQVAKQLGSGYRVMGIKTYLNVFRKDYKVILPENAVLYPILSTHYLLPQLELINK